MTTYIALFSLTDAGIKAAKDSPRRLDAAKKLLTDMGGEMKQFYMVLGDFDFVGICEAPDDAVMARYVLQLGGLGFVRTKTLKAFPEAAYREIIRSLGLTLKPIEAESSTRRFREGDETNRGGGPAKGEDHRRWSWSSPLRTLPLRHVSRS
jgi:uncharacterized protein with GYD domain